MRIGLVLLLSLLLLGCTAGSQSPPATVDRTPGVVSGRQPWEDKWDSLVSAGKKEGSVTIYGTYSADLREKVNAGFTQKYGIQIDWVTGTGSETSRRLAAEKTANLFLADMVIVGAPTQLMTLKAQEGYANLEPLIMLPEALDTKAWPEGKLPFLDKDKQIIYMTGGYFTWTLANTDMVKEGSVTSLKDLLKPDWKGKLVFSDPTITGAANSWVAFALRALGENDGAQYLRQLAAQDLTILKDRRLHIEWVAKGKNPLGIGIDDSITAEFFRAGAPIRWVNMKEGGVVHPTNTALAVPQNRAHPNASLVLLNWFLTADGQTAFSQGHGNPAVRYGVTTQGINPAIIPPKGQKLFYYDESYSALERKALDVAKDIFGPLLK